MKIRCGYCREPFGRALLQRFGNRLLCRRCLIALQSALTGRLARDDLLTTTETLSHQRVAWIATLAGVVSKGLLFSLFFLWAQRSATGSAALRGAVYADALTFLFLGVWDWPARRSQVTLAGAFEVGLVVVYLNRSSMFGIDASVPVLATSLLFFLLVALIKTGSWLADRTLRVTGVHERAPGSL